MKPIVWIAAALLAASPAAAEDLGAWTFKDLGPANDKGAHYFVAQAPSNELLTNTAGKPEKANLAIRCSDKGFFFTFVWPDYVNADTYDAKVIDVDFKLDGGKVHEAKFSKADQGAVALGKTGYKMLKDVVKGQTLSVHLPDFHGGQDATFPIKGIEAIYARISAQGCGKN